jgi:hypothetical protein
MEGIGSSAWNKAVDSTSHHGLPPAERGTAIMRQVDLLEPVNLTDRLPQLELYLSQVCSVAGISKMQLDYWTNKADIPTKGNKQRVYDMDAVEMVMLIKQAKDKGLNLGAAIAAAREYQQLQAEQRQIAS